MSKPAVGIKITLGGKTSTAGARPLSFAKPAASVRSVFSAFDASSDSASSASAAAVTTNHNSALSSAVVPDAKRARLASDNTSDASGSDEKLSSIDELIASGFLDRPLDASTVSAAAAGDDDD